MLALAKISAPCLYILPSIGRADKSLESMYVSPSGKHLVFLGDHGTLNIVDTHTKRLVDTLKMNGSSRAVAFNADGSRMFSHGGDGQVYVWDMKARACVHKFADEGCINGSALTVSPDSQLLATGCVRVCVAVLSLVISGVCRAVWAYCGMRCGALRTQFACTHGHRWDRELLKHARAHE